MAKLGALKGYLNILVAIILAVGTGVTRLYLDKNDGVLFWSGISIIIILLIISLFISKSIHKNIKSLKDI